LETLPENEHLQVDKPALTIHIHTWATPIVGLLMLVIGLTAGYFGRPLVSTALTKATSTPTAVEESTEPQNPEVQGLVVEQTKHFIGDANAPVTIIEFSDFQ